MKYYTHASKLFASSLKIANWKGTALVLIIIAYHVMHEKNAHAQKENHALLLSTFQNINN